MPRELFDLSSVDSLVRKVLAEHGPFELSQFNCEPYEIPGDFTVRDLQLPEDNYGGAIREAIDPIAKLAERRGYSSNVFTALYEAVKNAHEHGNGKSSRRVRLGYKFTDERAEFVVEDEGGVISPPFVPFVLLHREARHKGRPFNFYDFSGSAPSTTNNMGTGTSFMHLYMDDVAYFESPRNGLVVHMTKMRS